MATYEGMGFCDSSEYLGAFANRLKEDQITRGELYVARFQVEARPDIAYRMIGRAGLMIDLPDRRFIDFTLMDDHFQPIRMSSFAGHMKDGLWNPCVTLECYPSQTEQARMRNACLAEYDEGFDWDMDFGQELTLNRTRTLR